MHQSQGGHIHGRVTDVVLALERAGFTGCYGKRRRGVALWWLALAALLLASCGGDGSNPPPAVPTSPTPSPPPTPNPPGVPTGLVVSARGTDFIQWSWTPVPGVTGYQVQFSLDEAFTDEDEVIDRTAEQTTYRREDLPAETSAYLRVRSLTGTGEDRVHSSWSEHVTWMTEAPEAVKARGVDVHGPRDRSRGFEANRAANRGCVLHQ